MRISYVALLAAACGDAGATAPGVVDATLTLTVTESEPVEAVEAVVAVPEPEDVRTSATDRVLRRAPEPGAPVRGILAARAPFNVWETAEGPGCDEAWARVSQDGWACLSGTEATTSPAALVPTLVPFDPPQPSEWERYSGGNGYDRDPVADAERLLPFVYAKPFRRKWTGKLYASAEAYARGEAPVGQMNRGDHKYSFVRAEDTERGTVIVRADGQVAAADDVFFYPVDRFEGRDLVADPPPEGTAAAWAIGYEGSKMYAAPGDEEAEPARIVPYHAAFVVADAPVTPDGRWWEVPDGMGPGVSGYLIEDFDYPSFRRVDPGPIPAEVTPEQLWVDVHLRQQTLVLYRGDEPLFATMVSSGNKLPTPVGMFRIYDKFAYGDMEGRPDADYEPYLVENVPWVMHFAPRYALHGAFWHWGFGHVASHGCVNLAPKDARRLYDIVSPGVEPGMLAAMESPQEPGTMLRIRRDNPEVRDRRKPL